MLLVGAQRVLQPPAGAGQPRHHRANRHARDIADLVVRQPLQLAQNDYLPELGGKAVERAAERFRDRAIEQARFGVLVRDRIAVQLLVERCAERVGAVSAPPGVGGVAHDRQQPGTRAAALLPAEPADILERAQVGVLHDVLRVVVVPRQIARQRVRGVEMRQHDGFESLELVRLQPAL